MQFKPTSVDEAVRELNRSLSHLAPREERLAVVHQFREEYEEHRQINRSRSISLAQFMEKYLRDYLTARESYSH